MIAIISAGPDRKFETTCGAYNGGTIPGTVGADAASVVTQSGDDIVLEYTYAEAAVATSSLWTLKPSLSTTAVIGKNLEVGGTANIPAAVPSEATQVGTNLNAITSGIINAGAVVTKGAIIAGGAIQLAGSTSSAMTPVPVTNCNAADIGSMRYDAGTTAIQVCDGAGHWVSAAGSSASSLSSLTAATGPNTIDSLLSTQEWDWSTLATGAGLKLSTGGATNNLTSGSLLSLTSSSTAATPRPEAV